MQQDAMQAQAKIQNHLLKDFFPIWQMKLLKNCLTFIVLILKCSNMNTKLFYIRKFHSMEGFISTFSLLISLLITLWTSKFRNQFTISSKYFDMACYLKRETYSGPISFEVQQNDIWTDNIQSFEIPVVKPNYFKKQCSSSPFLLTWSIHTGPKWPLSTQKASPMSYMHRTSLSNTPWSFWTCIITSGK